MPAILRQIGRLLRPPPDEPQHVDLALQDETVRVTLRRNPKARRLVLRLSRDGSSAVLTVPRRIARARIIAFLEDSSGWLEAQLRKYRDTHAPSVKNKLLLMGQTYDVVPLGQSRGLLRIDAEAFTIHVPGDAAHIERRLKDWLKQKAKAELTAASRRYAEAMNTTFRRISVRDQKSRWGSCSAAGDLSYSWRLIMAPPFVLDYVAAHEVAHRIHMNHGQRYWRLLMQHNPDVRRARDWFKAHGAELHRYLP
jgi:predicted metal-dependent hydrolase